MDGKRKKTGSFLEKSEDEILNETQQKINLVISKDDLNEKLKQINHIRSM